VVDFEETSVRETGKFSDYAWRAQVWCKRVEEVTGRKPIIYTAKWFTNYFTTQQIGWMGDYPLWVAHYPWVVTSLTRPSIPPIWDKWTFWQFSADGNGRGDEFGTQSKSVDLNYWRPADILGHERTTPRTPDAGGTGETIRAGSIWRLDMALEYVEVVSFTVELAKVMPLTVECYKTASASVELAKVVTLTAYAELEDNS